MFALVSAWTPYSNIDLQNHFNITNGWNASFSGNVSAGFFQGDGSELTGVSANDATWLANYSAYNSTWSSTTNSTYDANNDSIINWVSSSFVELIGDTMTGDLDMGDNSILNANTINISNITYVNSFQSFDGNSIYVQPDGDEDDYFTFKTPTDRPTIKREGGKFIYFESSNVYDVGISFRKDDTYSGTLAYAKDDNIFKLLGKASSIAIVPNSEYLNYILFETLSEQPQISVFNGTILKINDNLEVIGYINSTDWNNVSVTESQISDLQTYRLDSWDNFTGIPTATPSNGDATHLSTADQIYDWVIALAYATTTYVDSLGNWSADKGSYSTTTYIDSIGNWSADKGDYSLTTAVTAQNTSQTNYINFANTSVTNTFGSYYTQTEADAINDSNNAYILWVNTTNSGEAYDDVWINGTIDAKILTNNGSVNNYILWVNSTNPVGEGSYDDAWINTTIDAKDVVINTSMKNYVDWNNVSVTNAIAAAGGTESDPKWTANWTNVAFTNVAETFASLVTFQNNITMGSAEGDNGIYFYEGGSATGEQIYWDDSLDEFKFTDSIRVDSLVSGTIQGTTFIVTSDIYTTGANDDLWVGSSTQGGAEFQANATGDVKVRNITSTSYFIGDGSMLTGVVSSDSTWTANWTNVAFTNVWETFVEKVNFTENISIGVAEGDHGICFYENGQYCGEQIFWDDSIDQFSFTDKIYVTGGAELSNGNTMISNGDLYTTGGADDFWLGSSTQSSAKIQLYADGHALFGDKTLNISTGGNVTSALDFCIESACLSNVGGSYNDAWINDTIDAKDVVVNTSIKNYVDNTFLQSLVGDTSPQLGGYLDTDGENIGSTSDEIENIYIATNSRMYFGDGQEASIYYNGTCFIMG